MKKLLLFGSLILLFASISPAPAQPKPVPVLPDTTAANLAQLARPGVNHYILDRLSGTWKITGEAWLDGFDKKPAQVSGIARCGTRINSRFLFMEDSLNIKNAVYESTALLGYDNVRKHYVMSRADNQSTSLGNFTGKADSAFKLITLENSPADSLSGRATHLRIVIRVINGNKHVIETWEIYPNGSALKLRELEYARIG